MRRAIVIFCILQSGALAQEGSSGFELRVAATGAAASSPQLENGQPDSRRFAPGFRAMLYPTWKLNRNWTVSGAVQVQSQPYFAEEFSTHGYGVKTDILQLHLGYSRFWNNNRSLVIRVGQLSSAFGSFLLRYDDWDNHLIGMPLSYGYYYKPVSVLGLAGGQVDATIGKLDMRAQFSNSSPANPRSVVDRDQYGSWTGGLGYTIRQGLRVGISSYRGPYLHRQYEYYFPGEGKPRDLPATGYGLDVQWGHGPWNVSGELQRFQLVYRAIPTLNEHTGYAELRRVLHPVAYVATRVGYLRANLFPGREVYEVAAGFRPSRFQLIKVGYQFQQGPSIRGRSADSFSVQFVTAFRPISIGRD